MFYSLMYRASAMLYRINPVLQQVLTHPLVQYIPLNKDPIVTKEDYPLVTGSQFNIRVFNRAEDLRPTLNRFDLDTEILRTIDWKSELPIISTNIELTELLYRTNKIVTIARPREKYLALFTVNRRYFYRDKVFFSVYDEQGRRMSTPTTFFTIDNTR